MGRKDHSSRLPTRGGAGQRPSLRGLISAPVGPIRRSNGLDLQRGDGFSIVPTIDSCVGPGAQGRENDDQAQERAGTTTSRNNSNNLTKEAVVDKTRLQVPSKAEAAMARRLSASFSNSQLPVGSPVVASENMTATHSTHVIKRKPVGSGVSASKLQPKFQVGGAVRSSLGNMKPLPEVPAAKNAKSRLSLFASKKKDSTPRLNLKKVSISTPKSAFETEVETATSDIKIRTIAYQHAPAPKPRLTKSRTLAALTNLTASLSRTSLVSDRKVSSSSKASINSIKTDSPPPAPLIPFPVLREEPRSPPSPNDVTTAQSSAYWAGRFLALHDRYKSDANLTEAPLRTLLAQAPGRIATRPGLTSSNTTVGLTTLSAYQPSSIRSLSSGRTHADDDTIALAVFCRLMEQCVTAEARESLAEWQLGYARKVGNAKLLPVGKTMGGSGGVVARFLGRQSIGGRTEGQNPKSEAITPMVGKKKRASIL